MCPNPQGTVDLITFTGEILNGNLHFLFAVTNFLYLSKMCVYFTVSQLVYINNIKYVFLSCLCNTNIHYASFAAGYRFIRR